ncbi:MAG TPA: hypothetical protein VHT49_14545 [Acidimicrobiales bacterium]|jgi:hypothetical protein|nr:hypothetical protein [Acidimicrobiales bacterium]
MDTGLGMHVIAYWANWRLSAGGDPVGQLILQADVRAVGWLMTRHLADIVGSAAAAITMGAAAGLALNRIRRARPGSSDRNPS